MFDDWSIGADYGDYGASSVGDFTGGEYTGGGYDFGGYDYTPVEGGILDATNDVYAPALNYGADPGFNYTGISDTGAGVSPLSFGMPTQSAIPGASYGESTRSSDDIGKLLSDKNISATTTKLPDESSWSDKLLKSGKSLFTTKDGDIDLKKVITAVQGLGGLYQAYARGKDSPNGNKTLTPAQLQATLPSQNNSQWTPQQQIWANKFFNESIPGVAEGNRRVVRAGEGGIKSIIPSQGYAEGGEVVDPDINKLLRQLYEQQEDGVVPTVKLLGLPEQGARIRIHGGGGDMAEGGEVGPLSHGNFGLVAGAGDGQSDTVPINVSPGEYVFDAETVSMLGNGSNDAGAQALDQWREYLREHKRGAATDEIGPESMDPNEYLPPEGAE
jgi:hypothetical protein